jgi:hypothetical protein
MGTAIGVWVRVSVVSCIFAVGCGGDDGKEGSSTEQPSSRSPACQKFQKATCEFAARCGIAPKDQCDVAARATFCKSDEVAESCAASLDAGSCDAPPSCNKEVIDTGPAVALCDQYLEATCRYLVSCDSTITADECKAEATSRIDCSTVVGATELVDDCLDQLDTAACGPSPAIPDVCKGTLLAVSGSTG